MALSDEHQPRGWPAQLLYLSANRARATARNPYPAGSGGRASLDVQAVVNQCYEDGAYEATLDYREPPPPPPFDADDAAWINDLLKSHRLR